MNVATLKSWWEGESKCPHSETVTGLAKDCLPCLTKLVEQQVNNAVDTFKANLLAIAEQPEQGITAVTQTELRRLLGDRRIGAEQRAKEGK